MRTLVRWFNGHRKLSICLLLFVGFMLLNLVAYLHARAMTHYVPKGIQTAPPEQLSFPDKLKVLLVGVQVPRPENNAAPDSVGLQYVTCRFPASDGKDLEGWYVDCSQAQGLVMLFHGYAGCRANLLAEAKAFHEMGYATLLVDFRGSGGSAGNITTIGVREADDVAQSAMFAATRWPSCPVILYGHSMGSAAILRAISVDDLRPAAAVVECPFNRLLDTVENRFAAMGLPSFPAAHLLVFWGGVQHGFNGFAHNPADYARDVNCPILLLHGGNDPRVSRQQAAEVFNNLAGPKQFEVFEDVGHESYVAARPERWRRCIEEFLRLHVATARR